MPKSPTNAQVARRERMRSTDTECDLSSGAKAHFAGEDDRHSCMGECMEMFESYCQVENIDPASRTGKHILRRFGNDFAECTLVRREFDEIMARTTAQLEQLYARMERKCVVPTRQMIHTNSDGTGGRIYDRFPEMFEEEARLCKLVSDIGSRTWLTIYDARGIEECSGVPESDDDDEDIEECDDDERIEAAAVRSFARIAMDDIDDDHQRALSPVLLDGATPPSPSASFVFVADDVSPPPSPADFASRPLSPCLASPRCDEEEEECAQSPYDGEAANPDFGGDEVPCCLWDHADCAHGPCSPGYLCAQDDL